MNRHLGRIRPGDEIRDAEQVEELVVGDPPPPPHEILAHHRDVRGGPAERDDPQTEEVQRDFPKWRHGLYAHGGAPKGPPHPPPPVPRRTQPAAPPAPA